MRKLWLILIFSIILTGIASAQDKTPAASSVQAAAAAVAEPPFDFAAADKELNKIERLLSSGKVSGKETSAYLKSLNDIQNAINQSRAQNAENLDNVQKKIAALGTAPADGEKEPADIAKQRKEFNPLNRQTSGQQSYRPFHFEKTFPKMKIILSFFILYIPFDHP